MSDKLEQLEYTLEKIIGIQKHAGKVRKICVYVLLSTDEQKVYRLTTLLCEVFIISIGKSFG